MAVPCITRGHCSKICMQRLVTKSINYEGKEVFKNLSEVRKSDIPNSRSMIMHHKVTSKKRKLIHDDDNETDSNFNNGINVKDCCNCIFSMEMLRWNPELDKGLNREGFSLMHLAVASGQQWLVKQLLNEEGSELCLVTDKNGLLPIHTAALKGRIGILRMLFDANREAAQITTCQGDNILHLSVKANCFAAVKFLVGAIGELLNAKDAKGNTVLHLAVARRQHQTVKFLLSKSRIDVNAFNLKNLTPLDVLLESPEENGDKFLVEKLMVAGGKPSISMAQSAPIQAHNAPVFKPEGSLTWPSNIDHKFEILRLPNGNAAAPDNPTVKRVYEDIPDFLMAVATSMANITLQSVLNPPGGFDQNSGDCKSAFFLKSNMVGLFTSWSILIITTVLKFMRPRTGRLLTVFLASLMIVSVISTVLAVSSSMFLIFPEPYHPTLRGFLGAWIWIIRIAITCGAMKSVMYLAQCLKKRCGDAKTIIILFTVSALTVALFFLNSVIFPAWTELLQLDFCSLFNESAITVNDKLGPSVAPNSTTCVQPLSLPSSTYCPEELYL